METMLFQSTEYRTGPDGRTQRWTRSVRMGEKVGPNEPCKCQSGKKFKKCCGDRVAWDEKTKAARAAKLVESVIPIADIENTAKAMDDADARRKKLSTDPRVMSAALLGLVAASAIRS